MKHIVTYGCIACMMLGILSGCRSSKQVAEVQEPKEEWVDKMATGALKEGTVSGKLNLQLSDGAKSVSVGGSCSFERDKAIQISLVALGFMEVGRLEMTPDYLLMIDRMGRQYVKVNYADVPYLQSATRLAKSWEDANNMRNSGALKCPSLLIPQGSRDMNSYSLNNFCLRVADKAELIILNILKFRTKVRKNPFA